MERQTWFQKAFGVRQGFQFFIRRHHPFVRVSFLLFSLGIRFEFGKETRSVVVHIGIEMVTQKLIDEWRPFLRDMRISQMLANNRTVFAFHQCIVVTMSGDFVSSISSLLSKPATLLLMYSRTIVGVKAHNDERELFNLPFQNGN